MKLEIDNIESLIDDAMSSLDDAIEYARRAYRAAEEVSAPSVEDLEYPITMRECMVFGLPMMIAKYGHSSNEVIEIEKFITDKP